MLKTEMTDDQVERRDAFVDQLTAAGWDPQGWEALFTAQQRLYPEAQAEYQNAAFNLRLSYYVGEGYVFLKANAKNGNTVLAFRFYPTRDAPAVVSKILDAQDSLSEETVSELIEKLKSICRLIVFETPDELIEIG